MGILARGSRRSQLRVSAGLAPASPGTPLTGKPVNCVPAPDLRARHDHSERDTTALSGPPRNLLPPNLPGLLSHRPCTVIDEPVPHLPVDASAHAWT